MQVGAETRKLTVAVVAACPFPCPRGTPTRILRLSEALAALGHDVHIITYHLGAEYTPPFPNLILHRIEDVSGYQKLDPGPSWRKLFVLDVMLIRKLRQVLHEYPVDLIHSHHYEGLLTAAMAGRRSGIPVVYDAHTLLSTELPYYGSGVPAALKSAFGKALDRIIPAAADAIICVTEEIKLSLASIVKLQDRIITIPNGVELDIFSIRRRSLSLSTDGEHDGKMVLYAGTLADYQRIDLLLQSFAKIAETRTDIHFKIVTDSDFGAYRKMSQELGIDSRIEFVSTSLLELAGMIAQADVAVNSRIQCDGLPQKNLNYLAAGVPIVCFAGSAKHLTDGETAFVVPDGDVQLFALAICRAIDSPDEAHAMGERGRSYVEKNCSWDLAAQTTELFFRYLVQEFDQLDGTITRA
jgi:glycosyltransferase involved in cell wall biosynthesis